MKIERIKQLVEQSKDFPKSYIEYSGELPEVENITPVSFYGVREVYNKNVPASVECSLSYSY